MARARHLQCQKFLPEGEVFENQIVSRTKGIENPAEDLSQAKGLLGGLARGSEALLVPVQWHPGEQVIEREWERLGPGQQVFDQLRAEWD